MTRPMTFLIDVDGCVFKHENGGAGTQWDQQHDPLPGAKDTLEALERAGHRIILMTARPHRCRRLLEEELAVCRIPYHQLITDCTGGTRCLVNDMKLPEDHPDFVPSCISVSVPRNQGISALKKFAETT